MKRRNFIEKKLHELEEKGSRLSNYCRDRDKCMDQYAGYKTKCRQSYKETYGETYDNDWRMMRELCEELEQIDWNEDTFELEQCRAKAEYWIGSVYKVLGQYDVALKYLIRAKRIVEKCAFQYDMPEYYIRTCMNMGICYMEKHSAPRKINQCIVKAEALLDSLRLENSADNKGSALNKELLKIRVELNLQKAMMALDSYGQEREEDDKEGYAWENLENAGAALKQYCNNYIGTDLGDNQDRDWCITQYDTLQGTMGIYFKNLYFESVHLIEADELEKNSARVAVLREIGQKVKDELLKKPEGSIDRLEDPPTRLNDFMIADPLAKELLLEDNQKSQMENLMALRSLFFEISFSIFAFHIHSNYKNTICLGNMAVLLSDYSRSIPDKMDVSKDKNFIIQVINNQRQNFMGQTNSEHEDEFSSIINIVNKNQENVVSQIIVKLLKIIYETESNNMFALNIDAEQINFFMSQSVPPQYDSYPVLRQSALKKRFIKMDSYVQKYIIAGRERYPNGTLAQWSEADEQYKQLKVDFIILYTRIVEYMNKAIVDVKSDAWKDRMVSHYTKSETVPLLIDKKGKSRLRLYNVNHLNDPLEGVLFMRQLENKTDLMGGGKDGLVEGVFRLCEPEEMGKIRSSVYMASFSGRMDQLNMWSRYGNDGRGCSLQLAASKSFDVSTRVPLGDFSNENTSNDYKLEDTRYPLYRVLYLPKEVIEENTYLYDCNLCAGKFSDFLQKEASLQKILIEQRNSQDSICGGNIENPNQSLGSLLSAQVCYCQLRSKAELDSIEQEWWAHQAELLREFIRLKEDTAKILIQLEEDFKHVDDLLTKASDSADNILEARNGLKREVSNTIMVILDLVRFLFKSDYYRDEREYRIIQYSADPEQDERPVPRLYVNMEKQLYYKKICFGPKVSNLASDEAYLLNIRRPDPEEKSKRWDLEVCSSEIPYRGKF